MSADWSPLVSIITPAYNRAKYIDEVIKSILDQDYSNIEYIVIDDGSTDGTLDVIKKYDGRIKWLTQSNMGETKTVNMGLAMAIGDIIGIVNSDDPLLKGAIAEIVEFMKAHPDIIVAYPDWVMIDSDGRPIMNMRTPDYDFLTMLGSHHCVPGPGTFFKRSVAEELRGRDTRFRFVGDFDFWLRAGLIGPFRRVPLMLATFRLHNDSASVNQKGFKMAEEHIALVNKIYSQSDLPESVRRIKNKAYGSAYLIAGCACSGGLSLLRLQYLATSFLYSPVYCVYRSCQILFYAINLRVRLLFRRLARTGRIE